MKILVTGAAGQLGRAVVTAASGRGHDVVGCSRDDLPVEDGGAVRAWIDALRPEVVVHCAAWTDVDGCERDPARALIVNASGAGHVAQACRAFDVGLVHVSTDFVFDGAATRPYQTEDEPAPISEYGRSKLLGERAVLAAAPPERCHVVRTSWVFGPEGRNFPAAILARARAGEPLRVVDDQSGSPTLTADLAEALLDLAAADAPSGVWHACNEGRCTWHEFAVAVVAGAGLDVPVGTRLPPSWIGQPGDPRGPCFAVPSWRPCAVGPYRRGATRCGAT